MSEQQDLEQRRMALQSGNHGIMRLVRKRIFFETTDAARQGFCKAGGRKVRLPDPEPMMRGTVFYRDPGPVDVPARPNPPSVEVCNEDSLCAAQRLTEEGFRPVVLNFANRRTPGGGVLDGSGAQEESIFRRTNVFLSLYQFHCNGELFDVPQRPERYPLDRETGGVYTPDAIVFRGPESEGCPFLAHPFRTSVATVAALNRPDLADLDELAPDMVPPTLSRMRSIFRIALLHGHDALILGAWGCGAFRNPPRHIARLFHDVMREDEFRDRFAKIVFAIIERKGVDDRPHSRGNLRAFQEEFSA